ncbi:MAG TPA: hypothetical protein VLJ10_03770, partial [Candidatus Bathyarchaeia archaeon]|nr:hypothetical protein [Candidatus Bathyarchaeia archaeon]
EMRNRELLWLSQDDKGNPLATYFHDGALGSIETFGQWSAAYDRQGENSIKVNKKNAEELAKAAFDKVVKEALGEDSVPKESIKSMNPLVYAQAEKAAEEAKVFYTIAAHGESAGWEKTRIDLKYSDKPEDQDVEDGVWVETEPEKVEHSLVDGMGLVDPGASRAWAASSSGLYRGSFSFKQGAMTFNKDGTRVIRMFDTVAEEMSADIFSKLNLSGAASKEEKELVEGPDITLKEEGRMIAFWPQISGGGTGGEVQGIDYVAASFLAKEKLKSEEKVGGRDVDTLLADITGVDPLGQKRGLAYTFQPWNSRLIGGTMLPALDGLRVEAAMLEGPIDGQQLLKSEQYQTNGIFLGENTTDDSGLNTFITVKQQDYLIRGMIELVNGKITKLPGGPGYSGAVSFILTDTNTVPSPNSDMPGVDPYKVGETQRQQAMVRYTEGAGQDDTFSFLDNQVKEFDPKGTLIHQEHWDKVASTNWYSLSQRFSISEQGDMNLNKANATFTLYDFYDEKVQLAADQTNSGPGYILKREFIWDDITPPSDGSVYPTSGRFAEISISEMSGVLKNQIWVPGLVGDPVQQAESQVKAVMDLGFSYEKAKEIQQILQSNIGSGDLNEKIFELKDATSEQKDAIIKLAEGKTMDAYAGLPAHMKASKSAIDPDKVDLEGTFAMAFGQRNKDGKLVMAPGSTLTPIPFEIKGSRFWTTEGTFQRGTVDEKEDTAPGSDKKAKIIIFGEDQEEFEGDGFLANASGGLYVAAAHGSIMGGFLGKNGAVVLGENGQWHVESGSPMLVENGSQKMFGLANNDNKIEKGWLYQTTMAGLPAMTPEQAAKMKMAVVADDVEKTILFSARIDGTDADAATANAFDFWDKSTKTYVPRVSSAMNDEDFVGVVTSNFGVKDADGKIVYRPLGWVDPDDHSQGAYTIDMEMLPTQVRKDSTIALGNINFKVKAGTDLYIDFFARQEGGKAAPSTSELRNAGIIKPFGEKEKAALQKKLLGENPTAEQIEAFEEYVKKNFEGKDLYTSEGPFEFQNPQAGESINTMLALHAYALVTGKTGPDLRDEIIKMSNALKDKAISNVFGSRLEALSITGAQRSAVEEILKNSSAGELDERLSTTVELTPQQKNEIKALYESVYETIQDQWSPTVAAAVLMTNALALDVDSAVSQLRDQQIMDASSPKAVIAQLMAAGKLTDAAQIAAIKAIFDENPDRIKNFDDLSEKIKAKKVDPIDERAYKETQRTLRDDAEKTVTTEKITAEVLKELTDDGTISRMSERMRSSAHGVQAVMKL